MGMSTDGILAYGYDLGGEECGWQIAEAGEYGDWEPEWYNQDAGDDFIESVESRILAGVVQFTESDWQVDGYFTRRREALTRAGVELGTYCSGDYPMHILAAYKIVVSRGSVETVNFSELEQARLDQGWNEKLRLAANALGITPKQAEPAWLLASYWG